MTSFLYVCTECKQKFARDTVRYLCPDCGKKYIPGAPLRGVLEVEFDYSEIAKCFTKANPDWELFSAVEKKYYPEYPVGGTHFSKASRLADKLNFKNLWIKFDGLNPSGSLKDRASFLIAAEAKRLGEKKIVAASTGNAASALAAVAAAAGFEAIIFVPESAPIAKLVSIVQYGAKIIPVHGTYDEAFRLSLEYTEKQGGLNRNTAYHPLTIEGKKTVGLEIFAQNNFTVPDAILVPVGDGVIISGVYKAFYDLMSAKITNRMPKLICVQAEKSNAIHNFLQTGKYQNAQDPATVADSISVSAPSNAYMAKRAVEETDGFSILVSDQEILNGQTMLASYAGIFAEPAAAATAAALAKISKQQLLASDQQIVLLVTGHGLKDINAAMKNITIPKAK
ncbi:MAG: threonine synthase [Gammaproteobacteria bacterium]|nr:threonine synthase [Gammaproteobacteria bacterium]